jgi:predicted nucleotidyltransferase
VSIQRDVLARMTTTLARRYPGCGILVAGSVQRGEERPDSDLDLFVVYPGDGTVHLEHETSPEGVKVDVALFPETGFLRQVPEEWHKFWMFSRAEIVYDPTGIARRNQGVALTYFRRHPDVDAAWERQIEEVRKHKAEPSYLPRYPTWDEFARHVETLVASAGRDA